MTYREAIELTEDSGTLLDSDSNTRREWEKLVVKALELQVDKEPIQYDQNTLVCMNCGNVLAYCKEQVDFIKANIHTNHCPNCGQTINYDCIKNI